MKKITATLIVLVALFLIITGNSAKDTVQTLQINGDTIAQQAKEPVRITHNPKAAAFTLYRNNDVIDTYSEKFPIVPEVASLRAIQYTGSYTIVVGETFWPSTTFNPGSNVKCEGLNYAVAAYKLQEGIIGKAAGTTTVRIFSPISDAPEETYEIKVIEPIDPKVKIDDSVLVTLPVINITDHSAVVNASCSVSLTRKGFVWSTSPSPTVDGKEDGGSIDLSQVSGFDRKIESVFVFNGNFYESKPLDEGTTYYVRAWGQVARVGESIRYGNEVSFTTLSSAERSVNTTVDVSDPNNITFKVEGDYLAKLDKNTTIYFAYCPTYSLLHGYDTSVDAIRDKKDSRTFSSATPLSTFDLHNDSEYRVQAYEMTKSGYTKLGKEVIFKNPAKKTRIYASGQPGIPTAEKPHWTHSTIPSKLSQGLPVDTVTLMDRAGYNTVLLRANVNVKGDILNPLASNGENLNWSVGGSIAPRYKDRVTAKDTTVKLDGVLVKMVKITITPGTFGKTKYTEDHFVTIIAKHANVPDESIVIEVLHPEVKAYANSDDGSISHKSHIVLPYQENVTNANVKFTTHVGTDKWSGMAARMGFTAASNLPGQAVKWKSVGGNMYSGTCPNGVGNGLSSKDSGEATLDICLPKDYMDKVNTKEHRYSASRTIRVYIDGMEDIYDDVEVFFSNNAEATIELIAQSDPEYLLNRAVSASAIGNDPQLRFLPTLLLPYIGYMFLAALVVIGAVALVITVIKIWNAYGQEILNFFQHIEEYIEERLRPCDKGYAKWAVDLVTTPVSIQDNLHQKIMEECFFTKDSPEYQTLTSSAASTDKNGQMRLLSVIREIKENEAAGYYEVHRSAYSGFLKSGNRFKVK
ncbi:hypothetical protein FACS1894162_7760 [Bacteroidia bacterium]|nr:hypothetical protein FACS1894162_7760 [Bacteroidia bacterium]